MAEPVSAKTIVIYNPLDYQALIAAAVVSQEFPEYEVLRFDKRIPLDFGTFIWIGCDQSILPVDTLFILAKKRVHHKVIKNTFNGLLNEVTGAKKSYKGKLANYFHSLYLKMASSGGRKRPLAAIKKVVERLRGAVIEDRLDRFVRFSHVPGVDSSVTLVDQVIVDLELSQVAKAKLYRSMSSKIRDFEVNPPFWGIHDRNIYSFEKGGFVYTSEETKTARELLFNYNRNIDYTHLLIKLAQKHLANRKNNPFFIPATGNEVSEEPYSLRMKEALNEFDGSWCLDTVLKANGRFEKVIRTNLSIDDSVYVMRYLRLCDRMYINVTNSVYGPIVSTNIDLNKKQELKYETSFVN